jgi:hypothetical protein
MKRDPDLCRAIMLSFEEVPAGQIIQTISLNGDNKMDVAKVFGHIDLLIGAGFLEGAVFPDQNEPANGMFYVEKITWAGHDFIESARCEGVWNKTKDRLKQAGSWTFSLLMDILRDEAKRQIGGFLT